MNARMCLSMCARGAMALCLKKPAAKARVEYSRCSCLSFGSCQAPPARREEDPGEALAAKRRKVRASARIFPRKIWSPCPAPSCARSKT